MKKKLFMLLPLFFLEACQLYPKIQIYNIKSPFDEKEAEKLMKPGKNTIIGNSFLRMRNGGIITCAGYKVTLIPVTAYAEERMLMLYNNKTKGFNPLVYNGQHLRKYQFEPEWAAYSDFTKETMCDSSGNFKFNNIADGSFYILTNVNWETPSQYNTIMNGGTLMEKITVKNGETKEIVISM